LREDSVDCNIVFVDVLGVNDKVADSGGVCRS